MDTLQGDKTIQQLGVEAQLCRIVNQDPPIFDFMCRVMIEEARLISEDEAITKQNFLKQLFLTYYGKTV